MKLLRYGPWSAEKPGLLDADGLIRDLSAFVPDIAGDVLNPEGLARLLAVDPASLPLVDGTPRLGPPVAGTRNYVGIGLNYADHAAEVGLPLPREPIVFLKSLSCLCGPNDDLPIPPDSTHTDWEAELAIVIGTTARRVPEDRAMEHVAGYATVNDVSEREWQNHRGGSWDKGKGFDGFGPLGPWLVTVDEVPDPAALAIETDVDGTAMQRGHTATIIFGITKLISYVSGCFTLYPGDVICTGTPPGVGNGRKPPVFLRPGQTIRIAVAGLGEQRQRVVAIE